MGWPTPQEYNEAVQNPRLCFTDPELQEGTVTLTRLGLPKAATGSFASVYCVTCGDTRYAVRCFLHNLPDQRLRYDRLSKTICNDTLEYTVDFEYQPEGIKVADSYFPMLKMAWVEGAHLDTFVKRYSDNTEQIEELQIRFRKMMNDLSDVGFAHSDLQHGNILITKEGLRLIDYDGMYVPALTGMTSNELGHRNYQHPARSKDHFGPYLDNFSAHVIDAALTVLLNDPELCKRLNLGDEAMIFRRADFLNPIESETFYLLEKHESQTIANASRALRTVINCLPFNVPPLWAEVALADELPRIVEERAAAKRMAEWAAIAAAEARQKENARRAQEEHERQQGKLAATRAGVKPDWLDENTAAVLAGREHKHATPSAPVAPPAVPAPPPADGAPAKPKFIVAYDQEKVYANLLTEPQNHLCKSLKDCEVVTASGMPFNYAKTNAVYHLYARNHNIALKFFCEELDNLVDRYTMIADAIVKLPDHAKSYLLKPHVLPYALQLSPDRWAPAVATEWQPNTTPLDAFLPEHKPDFDYTLLARFRRMMREIRSAGIWHGTIEPSNMLVRPALELLLVDYDNFSNAQMVAAGLPGTGVNCCSHPRLSPADSGAAADNFNSWLCDTALMVWSMDNRLWQRLNHVGAFGRPGKGAAFLGGATLVSHLSQHGQYELSDRSRFLQWCLDHKPKDVPPLTFDGTTPF